MKRVIIIFVFFILVFISGLWLGWKIRKPDVIEKEPEKVVVTEWKEKEVIVPPDTMDIMRILLERGIVRRYDDTTAVLRDYATERVYDTVMVFKDGGSLGIQANVQYNRLESLAYSYHPVVQERIRALRPFVSMGYLDGMQIGGGLLIKNRWQVGVMTNGKSIGGSVGYVF